MVVAITRLMLELETTVVESSVLKVVSTGDGEEADRVKVMKVLD